MDEKEITEIENAAVTNFAEMLCDYVSGLDEGEGIGREDIIDHLYEYINWDKRFTREYEEGKKNFKPFEIIKKRNRPATVYSQERSLYENQL